VPVLNKIDLPAPNPTGSRKQIEDVDGPRCRRRGMISGKDRARYRRGAGGAGDAIAAAAGDREAPLKALLSTAGMTLSRRRDPGAVKDGKLVAGQKIRLMATSANHAVERSACSPEGCHGAGTRCRAKSL